MKKLFFLLIMTLMPMMAWADDSGGCGINLTWKYEEATQTLTISGTGDMLDYTYQSQPWKDLIFQNLVIEDGVTSIGWYAFYNFSCITKIMGGNDLKSIGRYAFYGCRNLASIPLWPEVTSFGNYAFYNCSKLSSFPLGQKIYELGDFLFYNTKVTALSIPASLYVVPYDCFNGCNTIDTLNIENIAKWCNILFIERNPLISVNHLFVEGNEILDGTITIPDEVTNISSYAFLRCKVLSTLILGKNLKTIGKNSFAYCPNLKDVYVYAESVPSAWPDDDDDHDGTFQRTDLSAATLHVPASALEAYKTQLPWSKFGHIYAIGEEPNPQCATPTISFANGKIKFACETEDVDYVPTVTCTPSQTLTGDELELGTTYTVSVYAKREGYLDSEVATSTITLSTVGDVNGDGKLTIADVTSLVNAILGK